MTEELITDLASIQSLKVISRTSVMRFKGTHKPVREIARALGVEGIVEGSVMRAADRVRITAQLIHAAQDRHIWAQSFERDARDVLGLQREVAREIANQIQLRLSLQERARLGKARTVSPEANDLYLNGRYHWSRMSDSGFRQAIALYERAIAIDSLDARIYSGLADAYLFRAQVVGTMSFRDALPKVEAYATKALSLDETLPEIHISMGSALLWGAWDWTGAERHMKRAIELNPGLDGTHLAYATLLGARGRIEEAIASARRGYELSPLSQIASYVLTRELFQGRRYSEALAQARRTLELESNSLPGQLLMARIHEHMGQYREAIEAQESFLSPHAARVLREGYTHDGERGYWRAYLSLAMGRRTGLPVSPTFMALIYSRLGDNDRAFRVLDTALEQREGDCLFLASAPAFEGLRRDPRFAAVAKRLRIAESVDAAGS